MVLFICFQNALMHIPFSVEFMYITQRVDLMLLKTLYITGILYPFLFYCGIDQMNIKHHWTVV